MRIIGCRRMSGPAMRGRKGYARHIGIARKHPGQDLVCLLDVIAWDIPGYARGAGRSGDVEASDMRQEIEDARQVFDFLLCQQGSPVPEQLPRPLLWQCSGIGAAVETVLHDDDPFSGTFSMPCCFLSRASSWSTDMMTKRGLWCLVMTTGATAAASKRSLALRVTALAGNAFMEHDPDMTDYLEYTGNLYSLPENREKEAWTDGQEMANPSIPDKARKAPW